MNYSSNSSAWHIIWTGIFNIFGAIKDFMESVTVFSIGEAYSCNLWNFCLGVIIFGAIVGQFIIFSKPALPDQPTSSWREDKANRRYRRSVMTSKRKGG